jgi:hypothetical protein
MTPRSVAILWTVAQLHADFAYDDVQHYGDTPVAEKDNAWVAFADIELRGRDGRRAESRCRADRRRQRPCNGDRPGRPVMNLASLIAQAGIVALQRRPAPDSR